MGRNSRNGTSASDSAAGIQATASDENAIAGQKRRFGTYFPRAFACAYALIGDEAAAKEIVSEAFGRVLANSADLSEEEFIVELFAITRDLARSLIGVRKGALTCREQEVLAFVFDARLSHEEIRRLMGTTEQGLSAMLLRALRKLRSGTRPAAATA